MEIEKHQRKWGYMDREAADSSTMPPRQSPYITMTLAKISSRQYIYTEKRFPEAVAMARELSEWPLIYHCEGLIGVAMEGCQPGDVVALLLGSSHEMILRPCEEGHCLVGSTICAGSPADAWPIEGDEEGVETITLV
jgi:hypothetical protein